VYTAHKRTCAPVRPKLHVSSRASRARTHDRDTFFPFFSHLSKTWRIGPRDKNALITLRHPESKKVTESLETQFS